MHRSLFDPFIKGDRPESAPEPIVEPSKRIITPATAMTISRPVLAGIAAERLAHGKKGAFAPTLLMGASDMDGRLARFFDKHFPELGLGSTEFGAKADTIADASSLLLVGGALLRAPRVPATGKLAVATVLGQEGAKLAWAVNANHDYKELTGDQLYIPPTKGGKGAMAEKFAAFTLAALSNDLDGPISRQAAAAGALYFATVGALRGNEAVGLYKLEAAAMTREAQAVIDSQLSSVLEVDFCEVSPMLPGVAEQTA